MVFKLSLIEANQMVEREKGHSKWNEQYEKGMKAGNLLDLFNEYQVFHFV